MLGPAKTGKVVSEKERKLVAYHEAGHALAAASIEGADPVHKISIVSRGSAGGYTMKVPQDDAYFRTRSQFMGDLAMLLGGYAAEEEAFGEMSTGASNDLEKVAELARRIVTRYGMSEKMGPATFGHNTEASFLGRELAHGAHTSEATAADIDGEIKKLTLRAHALAKTIMKTRRTVLDAIANALLEKESLEQEEFAALVEPFGLSPLPA